MNNNIWFTSDSHFGHKNIIEYSNRPFADVEEMNELMIAKWNEKIGPDDNVYHLGDFALTPRNKLKPIIARLHGKIHLITGNHESSALDLADRFVWVKDYFELVVADEDAYKGQRLIVLLHYAMRVWNESHRGSWHLYGHSHSNLPDDERSLSFDVGVDCHDFYPLSYQDIKNIMAKKKWVPPFGPRQ